MPVKTAMPDMAPMLLELWLEAFPADSPEDIRLFFERALHDDQCMVWWEDNRPVSMLFLLPARLVTPGNGGHPLTLRYVYAAATLKRYRGQGIFALLLSEVHEHLRRRGIDACFLRPAESGLFHYYSRLGYQSFFYVCEETLSITDSIFHDNIHGVLIGNQPLSQARNRVLESYPVWVEWPELWLDYAVQQARQMGGDVLTDDNVWVICEPDGDTIRIREWVCSQKDENRLRQMVKERFPSATTIMRRRPCEMGDDASVPFGMLYPLTAAAQHCMQDMSSLSASYYPYMGLAFD